MDSKAHLDYALFQLTPTRTRCDLVVFSGKKSEKVASGLVEPFIAHLKYAKDHILKGGYSITLRPPATADDSPWFTKATFLRFVRFVSTPEILERIIQIEREILQIDRSIQYSEIPNLEATVHPTEGYVSVFNGNTKKPTNSSKSTSVENIHGEVLRENSRVRLQRLMDTRKALLQKEQAMAYARAVVAGYEIDTVDDLICFSDTFGASRMSDTVTSVQSMNQLVMGSTPVGGQKLETASLPLGRGKTAEACTDFKELYKKKHSDDQWIDELAAVQACPVSMTDLSYIATSGIMLAGDNSNSNETLSESANTTSSDRTKEINLPAPEQTSNVRQQAPWMNQIPPYMYNFRGPIQQIPPYYPYYPSHMGWPTPDGIVPSTNHRPSLKREKSPDANGISDASEEDEQTASSESDEEREHEKKKSSNGKKYVNKNKSKGSKTVVIRNINYITSQRHVGEDSEDDSSGDDEASIREGVDNAIASLEKHAHSKKDKNRGKQGSRAQVENRNDTDSIISEGVKMNNAWDAFQNLLMSHEESTPSELREHHPEDGHFATADDSLLVIHGEEVANRGKSHNVNFTNGEDIHFSMKNIVSEEENVSSSGQYKGSRNNNTTLVNVPDFSAGETTIKNRREEDWFIIENSSKNPETRDAKRLECANSVDLSFEKTKEAAGVDDSFMIESRSAFDEQYVSRWRTDINMDADIDMPKPEKGSPYISTSVEPDDLCMVLVRESRESGASWTPEMDYQVETFCSEADKRSPVIESDCRTGNSPDENGKNVNSKKNVGPTTKRIGRDVSRTLSGSLSRSKMDYVTKSKKTSPAMLQRSKLMKEEEERKRMEELRIQRQRRITERTTASGLTSASTKRLPVGNKSTTPPKPGKNTSPTMVQKLKSG
ncbi:hypothetical protein OROGR_001092 [Orobanche gracilis]